MGFYLSRGDADSVHTLVEECGELWDDPEAWQQHFACELERLLGGFGGNVVVLDQSLAIPAIQEGAMSPQNGESTRLLFAEFVRSGARTFPAVASIRTCLLTKGLFTATLAELAVSSEDGGASFHEQYLHPIGAGQMLYAAARSVGTRHLDVAVLREPRAPSFSDRHRNLIGALTAAVATRSGRRLTMRHQTGRHGLSPRANEVLDALLEGDSEKQVAARLGISTPTVHEHVTTLYRYFGARSRGELMAYFIRRRPIDRQRPSK